LGFLRPATSADYIAEMVETRLEPECLPDALSEVQVRVLATTPLGACQERLFAESADVRQQQQAWVRLLEQLSARLGERAVLSAHLEEDAQPEYAFRWQPLLEAGQYVPCTTAGTQQLAAEGNEETFFAARPLWLRHPPQAITVTSAMDNGFPLRFRWQGREHMVRRRWGPERIATGWWRAPVVERDYYRVETDRGQRFWLFRPAGTQQNTQCWFLQGVFE
jgi:protein ImuB